MLVARKRRPLPRTGGAALEFVVVLPLLLTLLLGCVDFGRFAYSYLAVINAARAGAGFGSVHPCTAATTPAWQTQVLQAVRDEMQGVSGFDPGKLSVVSAATPDADGSAWRAEVDVSYPFETLVNWPGMPAAVTLRQAVVMRGTRP